MRRRRDRPRATSAWVLWFLLVGMAGTGPAWALSKQGESRRGEMSGPLSLSGYLFVGPFLYNPTYASRPNNVGVAIVRGGGHLDLDFLNRRLTLSYDANLFFDVQTAGPSEWDHVLGLLTFVPLPRGLGLQLGAHFESDGPLDSLGGKYVQRYVDGAARLSWSSPGGRWSIFGVLGGFAFNPSYAARPDNSGLALLRYQVHGEVRLVPRVTLRADLNTFTDRLEHGRRRFRPSEADVTGELGVMLSSSTELRLVGEADVPLTRESAQELPSASPRPGVRQYYTAILLQWNFDGAGILRHFRSGPPSTALRPTFH